MQVLSVTGKDTIPARVHSDAKTPTRMEIPRAWQPTKRFRCRTCGKPYAVVEWKQDPKCRQCGEALQDADTTCLSAYRKTKTETHK